MTSFKFKKNNFDLIRLIAALQVAFMHGYEHFELERGRWLIDILSIFPGVPIFFVVSGFLISASFERSNSLKSYIQNRVLRIYPALWGCFIFSIITVFIFFEPSFTFEEISHWVLAQLTIGQFYNPDFLRSYGVGVLNGSLWTIPVELQFYLLLPLLYIIFNIVKWNLFFLLAMVIILALGSQYYASLLTDEKSLLLKLVGVSIAPYLYMFLFGVILQRNIDFVAKYLANKFLVIFSIYLASVAAAEALGLKYYSNHLNPLSALILALLTISAAYSYSYKFGDVLKGNDISYGVYIYHMVFVNMLLHTSKFAPWTSQALMLALTIVAAICSWKLVEKPALALKKYTINNASLGRI